MWDLGTGKHEGTLLGSKGNIRALAVSGEWLFSGGGDGFIREWSLRQRTALLSVMACDRRASGVMSEHIGTLVVSGTMLVSGSRGALHAEVRAWDLKTLKCKQKLSCSGDNVLGLLASKGEVWGGVDKDVVLWGRD